MSHDPETDVEFLARRLESALEDLGEKLSDALKTLVRAHASSPKPMTVDELRALAPSDRVRLARTLCDGTSSQVVPR